MPKPKPVKKVRKHNPKKAGPKSILFIVLDDDDEICGVYEAPFGVTAAGGEVAIGEAIDAAKKADPENWTYAEVRQALEKQGWRAVEWETVYE